jgi:hypothetical protein
MSQAQFSQRVDDLLATGGYDLPGAISQAAADSSNARDPFDVMREAALGVSK